LRNLSYHYTTQHRSLSNGLIVGHPELLDGWMILTRRCTDIDRALLKIDEVASSQDGVAVDEGMILRGYVAVRLKLGGRGMTE
jgi:hypothetical protein